MGRRMCVPVSEGARTCTSCLSASRQPQRHRPLPPCNAPLLSRGINEYGDPTDPLGDYNAVGTHLQVGGGRARVCVRVCVYVCVHVRKGGRGVQPGVTGVPRAMLASSSHSKPRRVPHSPTPTPPCTYAQCHNAPNNYRIGWAKPVNQIPGKGGDGWWGNLTAGNFTAASNHLRFTIPASGALFLPALHACVWFS